MQDHDRGAIAPSSDRQLPVPSALDATTLTLLAPLGAPNWDNTYYYTTIYVFVKGKKNKFGIFPRILRSVIENTPDICYNCYRVAFDIILPQIKRFIYGIFKSVFCIFLPRCLLFGIFFCQANENEKYNFTCFILDILCMGRTCSPAFTMPYDVYLLGGRITY